MATKINTISNALLLIGDDTINSLDEGTYRAKVASNLYDSIYENELSSYPWAFARKMQVLNKTTETPVTNEWRSIYQIPSDLITMIRVYPRVDYEIYGDKIYSNANTLTLDYIAKVPESTWPEYFNVLMQYALAKEFAVPIRENVGLTQIMEQRYLGAGQKARAQDSKQKIQRPIKSRPFIEYRYS